MKIVERSFVAAAALAALTFTDAAHAQAEVRTEEQWYGWQTTIGLGTAYSLAGVGLFVDAFEDYRGWFVGPAFGIYALTGPIVHLAHGRGGAAAGSLGLNLGVPLSAGFLGAGIYCLIDDCNGSYRGLAAVVAGIVFGTAGMVAANVIDVAVLSFEEVEVSAGSAKRSLGVGPAQYVPIFQYGGRF
ncbi:hypothetical protein [Chondromyces apiculatus]|uniref:Uncharacterized protein n=1 Tax=Chondromyces apiculatus DSM 436 TaxID=1192034 RepID=A0A017T2R4_9BACT|nr:hypothetical protein [Chondromyces apiculatus]EYF03518.1 Hypothetical protein CAP_5502 [Chondromyces apiculatus DSM 436]